MWFFVLSDIVLAQQFSYNLSSDGSSEWILVSYIAMDEFMSTVANLVVSLRTNYRFKFFLNIFKKYFLALFCASFSNSGSIWIIVFPSASLNYNTSNWVLATDSKGFHTSTIFHNFYVHWFSSSFSVNYA